MNEKAAPDGAGAGGLLLPQIGDLPPPPLSAAEAAAAGLVPMVSTAPTPMETVPMAATPVGVGADAMLVAPTSEALAMAAGAVVPVVGSKCAVADCVAPVGCVSLFSSSLCPWVCCVLGIFSPRNISGLLSVCVQPVKKSSQGEERDCCRQAHGRYPPSPPPALLLLYGTVQHLCAAYRVRFFVYSFSLSLCSST